MDFKEGFKSFLDFLLALAFISMSIIYQPSYGKDLNYLSELTRKANEINKNYIIGIDGLVISTRPNRYYSSIFKTVKPGTNLYIAYSWKDAIMLEIGYLSTTRKSKSFILARNNYFFNNRSLLADYILNGQVRFRNTHFDFNFISNFSENGSIMTSLGVGFVRPNITFKSLNLVTNQFVNNYISIIPKTSVIFRAGFGLAYGFNDKVFLRTMVYFDRYSLIKLRQPITFNKPFKNAYTGLIGVFSKII